MALGFPVLPAQGIEVFDMVAMVANVVVNAATFTWTTDLPTTQTNFAAAFLGVSNQRKVAGNTYIFGNSPDPAGNILIMVQRGPGAVVEFDCAAALFNVGDYVAPAQDVGLNLLNQTVVNLGPAVANAAKAIGRCCKAYTVNTTKVMVELASRFIVEKVQ
jgi:hypothetical protein